MLTTGPNSAGSTYLVNDVIESGDLNIERDSVIEDDFACK